MDAIRLPLAVLLWAVVGGLCIAVAVIVICVAAEVLRYYRQGKK